MEYFLSACISAVICTILEGKRERSPIAGALFGFVLPIISVIFTWRSYRKFVKQSVSKSSNIASRVVSNAQPQSTKGSAQDSVAGRKMDLSNLLIMPASGYYSQQVAGESYHEAELRKVVRALGGDGEHETLAVLVPEPTNKYDKNAIRVEIHGLLCGYVPSSETSELKPMIDYAAKMGKQFGMYARVWSGDDEYGNGHRGSDWMASVQLDSGRNFALAFPLNQLQENEVAWPTGGSLKVQVASENQSTVSEILSGAYVTGACSVYLRMESVEIDPGKQTIGLFFGEKLLGSLTTTTANKFLPVLAKLPEGKKIVALSTIEGNSVAVQINASLLSPEKLSEQELKAIGLGI